MSFAPSPVPVNDRDGDEKDSLFSSEEPEGTLIELHY